MNCSHHPSLLPMVIFSSAREKERYCLYAKLMAHLFGVSRRSQLCGHRLDWVKTAFFSLEESIPTYTPYGVRTDR